MRDMDSIEFSSKPMTLGNQLDISIIQSEQNDSADGLFAMIRLLADRSGEPESYWLSQPATDEKLFRAIQRMLALMDTTPVVD